MKHSEFTQKFHWMNGLSEYFRETGQEERYEPIFKALYHQNYYRKRDIIMNMVEGKYEGIENVSYELRRAWVNMLLNEHMDDVEVKTELITSLIATVADDDFVNRIAEFINYFAVDHSTDLLLPDLGDFLSRGQVKSKIWLATELANCVEGNLGNVVFYGGWYNFVAYFLFSQFKVNKIYSFDLDPNVDIPTGKLYSKEVSENRFISVTHDVNKLLWNEKTMTYVNELKQSVDEQINMVVNTSCEHMNNTWYENLPEGTFVALQTNNYFENPQHSNCCNDINDAKSKYPMQSVMYEGELDTQLYNRFMLIGIK
tara:strand:- start:1039 stop:1977 length:939 start_codon:yes stop_codon:yes gene_type:complete